MDDESGTVKLVSLGGIREMIPSFLRSVARLRGVTRSGSIHIVGGRM
jgi:hypothetical protein